MRTLASLALAVLAASTLAADSSEWQILREHIRKTLHVPENLPALREKFYGQFSPAPDVAADRVSYYTDYDLRIPAIIYHQQGATISRHPALIVVNGDGGDKSSAYASRAGILYARAGAVVLTYDPIGEFERNKERRSGTRQSDEVVPPAEQMRLRMMGFQVSDVLQAAHYLASRKDVDNKRIAVLGFSSGSVITSLACAVAADIRACVLAGPDDPYKSLAFLGESGPPAVFALNAKRGPTLVWTGPNEANSFEKLRDDAAARLGNSKNIFESGITPSGGSSAYFLARPIVLWLNEKLKFPNWTRKQILEMPESHFGDGIPAVRRDDLHAIPDAVWSSEAESFIYETWLERAKSAVEASAP